MGFSRYQLLEHAMFLVVADNASAQLNDLFRGLVIHRIRKKKQGPVVAAGKRALNNETFW
jgi:hypothetical protein